MNKLFLGLLAAVFLVSCSNSKEGSNKSPLIAEVEQTGSGDFGSIDFNSTLTKNISFKNTSSLTYSLGSLSFSNPVFRIVSAKNCSSLPPQGVCSLRVMVDGQGIMAGTHQENLSMGDLGTVPFSVVVNTTPNPIIETQIDGVVGSEINWSVSGRHTSHKIIVFRNIGPVVMPASSLVKDLEEVKVSSNACSLPLYPGKSCFIRLSVKGSNVEQEKEGVVSLGSISLPINLSFSLVAENPNLEASNDEVDFGDFTEEGEKGVEIITFYNSGNAQANLDLQGLPSGVSVLASNCGSVPPKGKCQVRLQLTNSSSDLGQQSSQVNLGNSQVTIKSSVVSSLPLSVISLSSIEDAMVDQCVALQMSLETSSGSFITSSEKNVSLSGASFYSNSSCSSSISSVVIAPFDHMATVYMSSATSGNKNLQATLDLVSGSKTLHVFDDLHISPLSSSITLANTQLFSPTGGKSPYTFSKISGVGSINSSGVFSSNVAGSATVRVQDAMGNIAEASVSIASNLLVSQGTCASGLIEGKDCQITASGGVGTLSYSSSKGAITSSGSFYGVCVNNVGQADITVADQYGNSASVSVSYSCVYKTCSELRAKGFGASSGNYWLDPDGTFRGGTTTPFNVFCDFRAGGTFAFMAEKKAADGFYYPSSTAHLGRVFGFYDFGPSANGTFSVDMNKFSSLPGTIRLEDGVYNYVMSWNGASEFKYVSSANLSSNPPGKIWTLNNTGFTAPAVGTNLVMESRALGSIEDQCGMTERNGSNPHAGISSFYFLGLNPASGWTTIGSQNLCPYGLGAHGDYNYDGYAWLGGYRTPAGTAIKIYYQDIYYHHPVSCNDAKQKGAKNTLGTTGNGTYTIDPDGYLYGNAPYDVVCDMETDSYGWQQVTSTTYSTAKMLAGKQFVKAVDDQGTVGVGLGVQVIGLFPNAARSTNVLVGKPTLLTKKAYTTHSVPVVGYNYMGGNNWFLNNNIDVGTTYYMIFFAEGTAGLIHAISNGAASNNEDAYIYYRKYTYTLWERP